MNLNLLPQLLAERDAIVFKALGYYYRLRDRNYIFTGDYQVNEIVADPIYPGQAPVDIETAISNFTREKCELVPEAWTSTADLYKAFCTFCPGFCSQVTFAKELKSLVERAYTSVQKARGGSRTGGKNALSGFRGIRIRTGGGENNEEE